MGGAGNTAERSVFMPCREHEYLRSFAAKGFVVVPKVVSAELIQNAREAIAARVREDPPPPCHCGPHFYFIVRDLPPPLLSPLYDSGAIIAAQSVIAPGTFDEPDHVQISLNIPPWSHRPDGPHIDGLTPPEADGRPGTFTALVGIFLTDQTQENCGNLWVWPGSHWETSEYLRQHGPDALLSAAPYPPIKLAPPIQVTGCAGDLLLAHYLLGHNMGGNTSGRTREVLYFRLRRTGHRIHWRDMVQNPLLEFGPVQASLQHTPQ